MRWLLILALLLPFELNAAGRTYKEAEKDKIYVTCRLAKKKIILTQKICFYTGTNNTTETIFISRFEYCPSEIRCIYEPNKKKPMVQEMFKSIEESLR